MLTDTRIDRPAVAFRLLDFPTVVIHAPRVIPEETSVKSLFDPQNSTLNPIIDFNRGKSCLFSMSSAMFSRSIAQIPLYLMLVDIADLDSQAHLLATANIDISEFLVSFFFAALTNKRFSTEYYRLVLYPLEIRLWDTTGQLLRSLILWFVSLISSLNLQPFACSQILLAVRLSLSVSPPSDRHYCPTWQALHPMWRSHAPRLHCRPKLHRQHQTSRFCVCPR